MHFYYYYLPQLDQLAEDESAEKLVNIISWEGTGLARNRPGLGDLQILSDYVGNYRNSQPRILSIILSQQETILRNK